ncbi:hypothetical protein LguiB_018397 [Lonicera macranthoides]
MNHVHYEDENNRYLNLGCVEKYFHMMACWADEPNSSAYKHHLARVPDYLWLAEDGMKVQPLEEQGKPCSSRNSLVNCWAHGEHTMGLGPFLRDAMEHTMGFSPKGLITMCSHCDAPNPVKRISPPEPG